MAKKKPVWRWIGEALLVFASVLGAFMVEDYRHNKQEKEDYVNTLVSFRNDIHKEIRNLRFTYDTSSVIRNKYQPVPLLIKDRLVLREVEILLGDNDRENDLIALDKFKDEIQFWADWRTQSGFLEPLSRYSEWILKDSLVQTLSYYSYLMGTEFVSYNRWNINRQKFQDWHNMTFNHKLKNDPSNYRIANSNYFLNTSILFAMLVDGIIRDDDFEARRLSGHLIKIDDVLTRYGIDTSKLDKKFLHQKPLE